jgi:4-diphosphocytidyl-2-C-methyl-D-erythritol kinase
VTRPGAVGTTARRAPAKLNLTLEVLARREDGYHEIETVLMTLPWGDDVQVTVAEGRGRQVALEVTGACDGVPTDASNLAVRAAQAVLDHAGVDGVAVRVALHKRIAPGAGLGGGSSDAAAVLVLLGERFGVPTAAQCALAAGLGSDVPFLVGGGAAIARGRGERLEPLPTVRLVPVVLVLAPFGCPTGQVYARSAERIRRAPADTLARAVAALASGDPAAWRAAHHNDLALAALRVEPRLRDLAREMEVRLGRPPLLSGSGSTLYDVPDAGEEERVVAALAGLPGRRVLVRP